MAREKKRNGPVKQKETWDYKIGPALAYKKLL